MSKFAVIKTGGKQYIVREKNKLKLEKLPQTEGKSFEFEEVLLVVDGDKVKIGMPQVEGAKVQAKVLEQGRGKKIRVVKYKPKTRYHKVQGHRQKYTKVEIEKII